MSDAESPADLPTPGDLVRAALARLVAESGVTAADSAAMAGAKVVDRLHAAGCAGHPCDPVGCPVYLYLAPEVPGCRLLATPTRVVVSDPWCDGKCRRWVVDMPAAVQAAVEMIRTLRVPRGLLTEAA